jgi:hypothetical protein
LDNVNLNRIDSKVTAEKIALGSQRGELWFTTGLGPENHVLSSPKSHECLQVPTFILDEIAAGWSPACIKIDVEGYEIEVLRGGGDTFSSRSLIACIIELNGSGRRYGFHDDETHRLMLDFGFAPASYQPDKRELQFLSNFRATGNTIYVRPSSELTDRLNTGEPVEVLGCVY